MFGRDFRGRGQRMEECLDALRRAWTGEAFEFEGRAIRVTPTPATPGGPGLMMGGRTAVAARRAARFGLGMIAQEGHPELADIYRAECEKHGQTPGLMISPAEGSVTAGFVAEDPERAWAQIGPYLLHDARMYARWQGEEQARKAGQLAETVDELRLAGGIYRIFTPDEAVAHIRSAGLFIAQPLTGGLPPDLAWPSLELLAKEVLPRVRDSK